MSTIGMTIPKMKSFSYRIVGGVMELSDGKREIVPCDMVFAPAGVKHATYNPHVEPLRAIIIKSPPDK